MSSDLRGTPEGRLWALLDELEKRFPDPEPYAAAPSELRYLAAIDAAASRERGLEAQLDDEKAKVRGLRAELGLVKARAELAEARVAELERELEECQQNR